MKDPFQKRPTAAFLAALGFVLLCLLASSALEDPPITTRTAATDEWR
ncbi:MAG: hypothetical protein ISR76_01265 [Planctomycetes bacterium]|nr:hypothetical protein [Planctomycetota bacterium]MBL7007598.1 hypothetical protein [Planctomycetota bacterium]